MSYPTPQDPFNSHGMPAVPSPKRRRPRLLLVALLVLGLTAGLITLAAVVPKLVDARTGAEAAPDASPDGPLTEVQVECSAVKHEYVLWKRTDEDFNLLVSSKTRTVADMRMNSLSEAGKAFSKAAGGYKDEPSKNLATSILQHNYDLSVINLELVATNVINVENYDKARVSRREIEKNYESFLVLTCA